MKLGDNVTFTYGEQLDFAILFYALAQILTSEGWATGTTATSDFANTALLTGINVFDSQGQAVPLFSITSASGTQYKAGGVVAPVPEPATLSLLGLGLAGAAVRRFRKRG